MELKSTINIILKDLEEARLIIDDLKNYPGVPAIQIELAKAKCRSAEDVIKLLTEYDIITGREPEPATKPEPTTESEPEPIIEPKPEPAKKPVHKKEIIADKFAPASSLNEQLGSADKKGGKGDIMKSRPVKELSEAIGINDRFYFIRELFSGDQKSYNETIEKLNIVNSIDEASELLATVTSQPDYAESFQQLLELVERKLLSKDK
ncbi:MAG: procyclic acidic repetitive family protein [Bacteroidales bacterium]|nr:procyclic acidic repetitive family protein [Bacteroidales bacterium]